MQHLPAPVSFPFDADLIDFVLTSLPDIRSLESFILSSKFVYNAFDTRRDSILRAVVSNHLGPVTAPAMRLVRVMMNVGAYWRGWLAPLPVSKLPSEDDFQPSPSTDRPSFVVTMREALVLAANHDIVLELEGIFSWRKKDPRSCSSRLTPEESDIFQTALYRVWFASSLYGRPAPAYRIGSSKSMRLAAIQMDLNREVRSFLQSFSRSQLAPFWQVWMFLGELANWAAQAELFPKKYNGSLPAYLTWSGPRTTLRAFQGKLTTMDLKAVASLSAVYQHFCGIFCETVTLKEQCGEVLVCPTECFMNTLTCHRCSRQNSGSLWSESNWSYLRGLIPPSQFCTFIELPWWDPSTDADSLTEICRSMPYAQLIREVFVHRSTTYRYWLPEHWLCITCFKKFMSINIASFCSSRALPEQADQ